MAQSLKDIIVVLCRVRESGNVGSVCRAMKAMGIDNLYLVDCPLYDEERLSALAVHAKDLYDKAIRFPTLQEALAATALSAGFTRRSGEKRKTSTRSLGEFASSLRNEASAPLALVFGNERTGLSDEELSECSLSVHIPTSEFCPSLNVSQAVQIACYEFARSILSQPEDSGVHPPENIAVLPTRTRIDNEVDKILVLLHHKGFFKKSGDGYARRFFRDLLQRARVQESELKWFGAFIRKIAAVSDSPSPRTRK
jgi:TrmH family RNA methyltransferase